MLRQTKTRYMVQLSLLISIQIVLTVTPLGMIMIPGLPVHITLIHIPVLIAAITMGPMAGGILGAVFGLSSMIIATMRGTLDSIVFSPFLSQSGWSLVISLVPRILFGIFAAWIFIALRKIKVGEHLSAAFSAAIATLLHSVMVLGAIYFLMGNYYAELMGIAHGTLLTAFGVVLITNGVIEAITATIVCVF